MLEPHTSAYVHAVAERVCSDMAFEDAKRALDVRTSCEALVMLHVRAAQGQTTMNLHVRQLAGHDRMRRAMREVLHLLQGTPVLQAVALYLAQAEDIVRRSAG
jgi:hypothetical protein